MRDIIKTKEERDSLAEELLSFTGAKKWFKADPIFVDGGVGKILLKLKLIKDFLKREYPDRWKIILRKDFGTLINKYPDADLLVTVDKHKIPFSGFEIV